MKNVIIHNANGALSSGATHSLLGLLKYLKTDNVFNPIVILSGHGELENKLKENDIEYYVIREPIKWCCKINSKRCFIKDLIRPFANLYTNWQIKRIIFQKKIKLVHVNMLTTGNVGIIAEKMNIPVIWHIREFLEEDLNQQFCNREKSINIINKSASIIAISESVKRKYQSIFTTHIKVIYNGIDFDKNEIEDRMIFRNKLIKIGIFGRLTPEKGQLELLEALALIPLEKRENIRIEIYGNIRDDKYYQRIQNFLIDHELTEYVDYKGYTNNSLSTMKTMDCICVCSKSEAFGRVTVEGMIAGCLVIGAKNGGTIELIQDGVTGLLYETGDKKNLADTIFFAINNKLKMNEIAKRAQIEAINTYTAKNNAKLIQKEYKKILNII